jgi:hypothetical protein
MGGQSMKKGAEICQCQGRSPGQVHFELPFFIHLGWQGHLLIWLISRRHAKVGIHPASTWIWPADKKSQLRPSFWLNDGRKPLRLSLPLNDENFTKQTATPSVRFICCAAFI